MQPRALAVYGRPMVKAIVLKCAGSKEDCSNETMEVGVLYRVEALYEADPSKSRDASLVARAVEEAVARLRSKYPNVNIVYIEVTDPVGDGSRLRITMDVFDPRIGSLAPVLLIVEIIIALALILMALGILVGAIRFFIFMVKAPADLIIEKFIDTVKDIGQAVGSHASGHGGGGGGSGSGSGGGGGGEEDKRKKAREIEEYASVAAALLVLGYIGYRLFFKRGGR